MRVQGAVGPLDAVQGLHEGMVLGVLPPLQRHLVTHLLHRKPAPLAL